MDLRDLKNRVFTRVTTIQEEVTCWECTNQVLPNTPEEKKGIRFKDGSSVILCLKHFIALLKLKS
jgi:hypothetical protein